MMSQNPEEPRESPADDKDYESGLDYGAFVSEEPDFPEDHFETEPSADNDDASAEQEQPSEPAPEPSTAPAAGIPAPPAAVSPEEDEQATEVVPPSTGDQTTTVLPREQQPVGAAAPAASPATAAAPPQEHLPQQRPSEQPVTAPPAQRVPAPPNEDELQEEVEKSRRGISRFFTVLIAIFTPLVLAVLAIRVVASPLFLMFTYWRPGFPQDPGGWDLRERLLYGSYGTDFLLNAADSRYLNQLAPGGEPLFTEAEVSHMADVKILIWYAMIIAAGLVVISLLLALLLRRWRPGGFARGLFAGAWVTLGLMVAGVVTPLLIGWERFFTEFHHLFFPQGNWSFASDSALIRLYPEQFWIDAGIWLGVLLLLMSLIVLLITWPTKRRRARRAERLAEIHERRRAKLEEELNQAAAAS
ncbi:DUF1461 domain-containing protein [Nesterenkonia muleiensis]|uniref:DUF1461 domain-containing protein n=1 Tax=Nesterenkonia muleiensis TaxID=2282648 RepID=UPI000E72B3F6|nr:DUF1461 domain-containing protein [Nesterenkonia muleiensis]